MATFKVKFSKSKDQKFVTIRYDGGDSIAGASSLVASVYTDDFTAADRTYTLSAEELSNLKLGYCTLDITDLVGADAPDAWYSVVLAQGTSYESVISGFGLTYQATYKVYGKQGYVDVYGHDYRIDEVLHTAHMLLSEMNAIEDIEVSFQKREDFEVRLQMLKKILNY